MSRSGEPRSPPRCPRPAFRSPIRASRRHASRCRRCCRRTRVPSISCSSGPGPPHWPLVFMTVLTQLSVGALATIWLLHLLGASTRLDLAALTAVLVGGLALAASTLHLGRPVHAYRALKMWRRSWLSREVLLFSAFRGGGLRLRRRALAGPAGSGRRRADRPPRVRRRDGERLHLPRPVPPAWNTPFTVVQFHLTAATSARCSSRRSAPANRGCSASRRQAWPPRRWWRWRSASSG